MSSKSEDWKANLRRLKVTATAVTFLTAYCNAYQKHNCRAIALPYIIGRASLLGHMSPSLKQKKKTTRKKQLVSPPNCAAGGQIDTPTCASCLPSGTHPWRQMDVAVLSVACPVGDLIGMS